MSIEQYPFSDLLCQFRARAQLSQEALAARVAVASPRSTARAASVAYWLYLLTLALGTVVIEGLVVPGDTSATATSILAHEPAFRMGFELDLISIAFYLAATVLIYDLFRPVNGTLSLLVAFCNLVGSAIHGVRTIFPLAVLLVLGGGDAASAFKSTFLPYVLGALAVLSGLCWLTFLAPPLADTVFPGIHVLGVLGEFSLMVWLLVRSVNVQRWKEQATAAGRPSLMGVAVSTDIGATSMAPPESRAPRPPARRNMAADACCEPGGRTHRL